jgi:hypothetical protein
MGFQLNHSALTQSKSTSSLNAYKQSNISLKIDVVFGLLQPISEFQWVCQGPSSWANIEGNSLIH